MEDKLLESISYILPAAVTGLVAYYMFKGFIKNKSYEKKLELLAQRKKESLPIKLQACERLLLFSDRINPVKMLMRIPPISADKKDYLNLLLANIAQEFAHNLVQQIYVSENTWTAIFTAKNAVIKQLREVAEEATFADEMRENIFLVYTKTTPPTEIAIEFIKEEVRSLL
tara:strand:+ start:430 stop:942 length:513 start_codon:yes stop_codon:yes gene_type:complete